MSVMVYGAANLVTTKLNTGSPGGSGDGRGLTSVPTVLTAF